VKFSNYAPAPRHALVAWEQRNTCMLPEDLKNFYLTTDGLLLTWKVSIDGDYFFLSIVSIFTVYIQPGFF